MSEQAHELLIKGKKAYESRDYKTAEKNYKAVLDEPSMDNYNKRCALVALNIIYGDTDGFQDFSKSVEVNKKLLEMDKSWETKTNLAESLLKAENYAEARKYALEVVNESDYTTGGKRDHMIFRDTLDAEGYKIVNTFFTLCSQLLDGNGDFKIPVNKWNFVALANSIKSSKASEKTKKALLDIIDSFS